MVLMAQSDVRLEVASSIEVDHETFSMVILFLPLIQEGLLLIKFATVLVYRLYTRM